MSSLIVYDGYHVKWNNRNKGIKQAKRHNIIVYVMESVMIKYQTGRNTFFQCFYTFPYIRLWYLQRNVCIVLLVACRVIMYLSKICVEFFKISCNKQRPYRPTYCG